MEDFAMPAGAALRCALPRLDVRRAAAYAESGVMLPGATWHDPERVDDWGRALCAAGVRECLVYCVHGHEVGRNTAARLRELGVQAHYLTGGIEGWKDAGLPVQPKEHGS